MRGAIIATAGFLLLLALVPTAAAEEMKETMAARGFLEHPPPGSGGIALSTGESITFDWTARRADGVPMNVTFNVHYNEKSEPRELKYTVGPETGSGAPGMFTAPQDDAYYFMWENPNPVPVDITLTYDIERIGGGENGGNPLPVPAVLAPFALAGVALALRKRP